MKKGNINMEKRFKMKIPSNLEECFKELLKSPQQDLDDWKKIPEHDAVCGLHFGSGMRMRNDWCLWGKNKLVEYFNYIGIYHADDMSSIIYTSFHRHLNKKPIKLKDQVKFYQDYWRRLGFKNGNPTDISEQNYRPIRDKRFIVIDLKNK
jgi:hypothetical protein